jgi:NAD(P)-dependent dehydrogenase (short-subunit alcohol dehydrogenase family)
MGSRCGRRGVARWARSGRKLDLLINNAGVMARPFTLTAQGLAHARRARSLGQARRGLPG